MRRGIRRPNRGQSTLEFIIAVAAALVMLVGFTKIWAWSTTLLVRRAHDAELNDPHRNGVSGGNVNSAELRKPEDVIISFFTPPQLSTLKRDSN